MLDYIDVKLCLFEYTYLRISMTSFIVCQGIKVCIS